MYKPFDSTVGLMVHDSSSKDLSVYLNEKSPKTLNELGSKTVDFLGHTID